MKKTSSNRGAASALAIVGLVIVGWTIGMFMQGLEVRQQHRTPAEKVTHNKIRVHPRPSVVNQIPQ